MSETPTKQTARKHLFLQAHLAKQGLRAAGVLIGIDQEVVTLRGLLRQLRVPD